MDLGSDHQIIVFHIQIDSVDREEEGTQGRSFKNNSTRIYNEKWFDWELYLRLQIVKEEKSKKPRINK